MTDDQTIRPSAAMVNLLWGRAGDSGGGGAVRATTPSGAAWVGFDFGLAAVHHLIEAWYCLKWRVVFRNGIVLEVYT